MEDFPKAQANWAYDDKNTPQKPLPAWDNTEPGAAIVQNARQRSVLRDSIGLTITGGNVASMSGLHWQAPEALPVGELRLTMHRKRLQIAQGFRDRETSENELGASP
jgi:hypothetical protein